MLKLNLINWNPNHVLSWADYPLVDQDPTGRGNTASTDFPNRVFWYSPSSVGDGTVNIDFRVDRSKSWVLRSWVQAKHNPDPVLIHELGHYNIGLLIVRDVVTLAPTLNKAAGNALIDKLSKRWNGLDFGVSGCYERTTDLGRNTLKQETWNTLLGLLLWTTPPSTDALRTNANAYLGCGAS
jgi:hypothetical protein